MDFCLIWIKVQTLPMAHLWALYYWLLADYLDLYLLALYFSSFYTNQLMFSWICKPSFCLRMFSLCLECSVSRCLHGSLPTLCLITLLSLRKDLVYQTYLQWQHIYRKCCCCWIQPYLLLLQKCAALVDSFLYMQDNLLICVPLLEDLLRVQVFAGLMGGVGWKYYSYYPKKQPSTN